MLLKKMGHESSYKKRFLWIDAQARTFHWSKRPDRISAHKSVSLLTDVQAAEFRAPPAKHGQLAGRGAGGRGADPALCLSLLLLSGDCIDVQVWGGGVSVM
jgi:hypothetical protein